MEIIMNSIEYFTWEIFTSLEENAWWLMMVVFTLTCITFIWTNAKIRESIQGIEELLNDILKEIIDE